MSNIIRLKSMTIRNIKNVANGKVEMPNCFNNILSYQNAEILGLYGQNGSGKTTVIDVLFFLQKIMIGMDLPKEFVDYIGGNGSDAEIIVEFNVFTDDIVYEVVYFIGFQKRDDKAIVLKESLKFAVNKDGERKNLKLFVEYRNDHASEIFRPKNRLEEVIGNNKDYKIDLMVAKRIAEKSNSSYIFAEASRNILTKIKSGEFADCSLIINSLFRFALADLFVIRNSHSGMISANLILPMAFRIDDYDKDCLGMKGDFPVSLNGPTLIPIEQLDVLRNIIAKINTVLSTIIPNLNIEVKDYGQQSLDNGTEGIKIELLSKRGEIVIPIRMESDGIIKIISILNALIQAFYNESICIVIDELDAGIFEYMLGELIDIFNKYARGQMVFTSHNLRALEMLSNESIMFSTTNPSNRYIHMKNVKTTNNMRNMYLRSITLGGLPEEIYEETDSLKIARAFRVASRCSENGKK